MGWRSRCHLPLTVLAVLMMFSEADGQSNFPSRNIELIVPYAAGAGTDAVARVLAESLRPVLGQSVVVVNRPGGNTVVGTMQVAHSMPDGHTLLMAGGAFVFNRASSNTLPYDPIKDFKPISLVATSQVALVVHPSVPASTVKEFVAWAKAKGEPISAASAGSGNSIHLATEMLKRHTGIELVTIPFQGGGPALTSVVAGDVPMMFNGSSAIQGFVETGKLRALGVTGKRRLDLFPTVPTFEEAGLPMPEADVGTWFGIVAPAKTPDDVARKLNTAIRQVMTEPQFVAAMARIGYDGQGTSAEDFGRLIDEQLTVWRAIIGTPGKP
jgi:tripartite-type tricarboxylate transporter receptor subunit TctC